MILDEFREIVKNPHDYAQKWKSENGRKVCGCLCGNVIEELIYAAGMLPVRIIADPKTPQTLAADHIQANRCACCRGCLELGLRGQYDYLDGLVHVQSCLIQSLAFSSWIIHRPLEFSHKMFRPFRLTPVAKKVYRDFIDDFRSHLEQWINSPISEESLVKSVATYRENRQLMKQVFKLRKQKPPIISGSDAQRMVLASMLMGKKEHSELLRQLLSELEEIKLPENKRPRVMIVGSGMSPLDCTELVEKAGADVVIEDHCLGSKYFWGEDATEKDPMDAITTYYYDNRPQCAFQDWTGEGTLKRLPRLADDYNVEAVIWIAQIFCGTHQWDIVDGIALFEKAGIPVLRLERGVSIPKERFRVKVEAFLKEVKSK